MYITDIDYVRALYESIINDSDFFIMSHYMTVDEAVERFVETQQNILQAQNREDKIKVLITNNGAGEIVNLNSAYISQARFRTTIAFETSFKQKVIEKLDTVANATRGLVYNMIKTKDGSIFTTIVPSVNANTIENKSLLYDDSFYVDDGNFISTWLGEEGYSSILKANDVFYVIKNSELNIVSITSVVSNVIVGDIVDTIPLNELEFRKLSISLNMLEYNDPEHINGQEVETLYIDGAFTLASKGIRLGNDLYKCTLQYQNAGGSLSTAVECEVFSSPSNLNNQTNPNQAFNSVREKTDVIKQANMRAYDFVLDNDNALLKALGIYADYGTTSTFNANAIWTITEYLNDFGVFPSISFKAKLVDIEKKNTNGDVYILTLKFEIGNY